MTYGGSLGRTAEEMRETLHFTGDAEKIHNGFAELNKALDEIRNRGSVRLAIANSIWPQIDHRFLPEYLALVQEQYAGSVIPVDYRRTPEKAIKEINAWVDTRTGGKISKIIKDIAPGTILVLANAVYFKGSWDHQFDPKATRESDFIC